MKKIVCLFAVLLLAAPLARAKDSAKADEAAAPGPLSCFSVGAYLSYWNIADLDEFDVSGAFGCCVIGQFRLHQLFALELRLSGFAAGDTEDVHIPGEGWVENTTTISVMPLEADVVGFLPLGETFSLYGGPGVGYYLFDGESRSTHGRWETIYDIDLDDAAGFYALLGARAQLARNVALFAEAKYTWVETSVKHDIVFAEALSDMGIPELEQDIDFSGLAINAGMLFTF